MTQNDLKHGIRFSGDKMEHERKKQPTDVMEAEFTNSHMTPNRKLPRF
jgi:hypothetical protein